VSDSAVGTNDQPGWTAGREQCIEVSTAGLPLQELVPQRGARLGERVGARCHSTGDASFARNAAPLVVGADVFEQGNKK
jgi:hypothetical protein